MGSKKFQEPLKKLWEKVKGKQALFLLGLCGILLLYFSGLTSSPSKEKKQEETLSGTPAAPEYEKQLEENLKVLISAITGEPSPAVMVTLESGSQIVYASDEKNILESDSSEEQVSHILLKDSDGSQHALMVTEIQPKVKGVVVVSKYAGSAYMREKLTQAVKTALDISSARVCVISTGNTN